MLWSNIDTITSDITDTTSTSFPTATRLIYANEFAREIGGDIIAIDKKWQWDDTNYTDLPIGVADLVDGQKDYSFDDTMIEIERVEVLDSDGIWRLVKPIDKAQIKVALSEYKKTDGLPTEYDKEGRSIKLYPSPATASVTASSGLRVYFKRTTKDITSFGSTEPGFVPTQHIILAYMIGLPYIQKYKPERVGLFLNEIAKRKKAILDHYGRRSKDEVFRLQPANESNK